MTGHSFRPKFIRPWVLLLMLSLTTVFVACGGGSANSNSTPAAGSNRATTLRVTPAPGSPNKDFFNPYYNTNQGSAYGSQGLLYEVLYFTNLYNGQTQPWLASNASYSTDLTQLTFTMRDGIKWNDGVALTSADVKYTFDLMKQYPALDQNGVLPLIKSVDAPSSTTVTFTLNHPDSTALFRIGDQVFIVPQHSWSKNTGDPSKFTNDQNPVGTGPYTLNHFDPNLVTYTRNPNYWGTKPEVQTIQVPSIKDNSTAITDMIKGTLDWLGSGWSPDLDTSYSAKDPTHNHTWFAASNTVMLYLNLNKAPFNNLLVRQAISAAINREQLPQGVAQYAKVANPTGVITPTLNDWISTPYQSATFQYSAAQAGTYLTQAGFTKKSDGYFYDAKGKEFTMTLNVVNGWNDWDQDTQFIAADLNAAGIKATVNTQSDYTPYYDSISKGTYDAALSWTNSGPTPYYGYQAMLASANSAAPGKAISGTNFERWDSTTSNGFSAQTDNFIKQYEETTDLATQKQAMAGIEDIMVKQLPVIPLTVNVYWDEYTTKNWTNWPDAGNPYDSGAPYIAPDNENVILHLKAAA